jgi:proteasome lid subunit RPN8/RPN11
MFEEYYEQCKQLAIKCYPKEACAVITEDGFKPVKNTSDDPNNSFRISKKALAIAYTNGLKAIFHSHPDYYDCPSQADMERQVETAVPWIICSTNGEVASTPIVFDHAAEPPALLGRGFRHGVTDCYSLIKDFYKTYLDITLNEFPRDWEWWLNGQDLYKEGFKTTGFRVISDYEVQPGDVFLAQLRSKTPNHGGVYLGNGLIVHHLTSNKAVDKTRLSSREPVYRWQKHITHWLRHEENNTVREISEIR